jgi:hypothetical protein
VAYTVNMSARVRDYLATLSGLTREGRVKLLEGTVGLLRDPRRRATFRALEASGA